VLLLIIAENFTCYTKEASLSVAFDPQDVFMTFKLFVLPKVHAVPCLTSQVSAFSCFVKIILYTDKCPMHALSILILCRCSGQVTINFICSVFLFKGNKYFLKIM